jgi:hypothetical protein
MSLIKKASAAAAALLFVSLAHAGTVVYETGTGNPWGNLTNDSAMDHAFGSGNWVKSNGFNTGMFSGASMVYLDGSDGQANQLSPFLSANQSVVESYVSNGGHLFINSAPNQGGTFNMDFGVTLHYQDFSGNATVTAAGVAAGLTAGGITTNYTGTSFSHSTVSGAGISDLVHGDTGIVFGAMNYGSGFVAFGGQTTTNFHSPNGDAQMLLANELKYVAAVPEPETYAMFGAGLGLLGLMARRRRRAAH